jgi:hypothetical protein
MNSFEQEFHRSQWHYVLPFGPHGIQPYVGRGRRSESPAGRPVMRRLAARLRSLAQGPIAFGRLAASAMPGGPSRPVR